MTTPCSKCGFLMDALDTDCIRCAQGGIILATNINCPSCGKDNSNKRHACVYCHERLNAPLENMERQSLTTYQKRATELARNGDMARALATLREAVDFYPDDINTRTVLTGVLERMGKHQEAQYNQEYLHLLQVRASANFAVQQGDMAFSSGDFQKAIENFETGIRYHPQCIALHEGLVAALECIGDTTRANTEKVIVGRLKSQQTDLQNKRQAMNDQAAHDAESAGMAAGVAVGATGAAVGGAISIVSVITGVAVALLGVVCCIISVLLFMTCIGFPLAILMVMVGFALIGTGFTIAMGGAVAGAGAGFLGIFTGMLTSGTAVMHRNSRKK